MIIPFKGGSVISSVSRILALINLKDYMLELIKHTQTNVSIWDNE